MALLPTTRVRLDGSNGQHEEWRSDAVLLVIRERNGVRVRTRLTSDDMPDMLAHLVAGYAEKLVRAGMSPEAAAFEVGDQWRKALSEGLAAIGQCVQEYTGTAYRMDRKR